MRRLVVITFLLASSAITFAQNATKTFYVNDEKKRDIVVFTSKAPLETIKGTTAEARGFVAVDPADISAAKARFEVDLASLKTGIGLRDEHMREQYLETNKYPNAVFELTRIASSSDKELLDQKSNQIMAEGNFSVHGVTRTITIPLTVTYIKESENTRAKSPGDILHIEGAWEIMLSDYNIPRPQFVLLKLDNKQKIEIDFFAATGFPEVTFAAANEKASAPK